ncbi:MAG: hypothetical protein GTN59_10680 [Candidatus Dadabacteria bacterium]|nr:hypothetical protein [Candidatus Dadabacteria bacterium]
MFKNQNVKNILLALAVAIFGFVLLNLIFLFYTLLTTLVEKFLPKDYPATHDWFGPLTFIIFVVIIAIISWFVFRSKLGVIYKAIYLTVPVAIFLLAIGMNLYPYPVIVYGLGILSVAGLLYYFYRTKKPWLYYYAVIIVALALFTMNLIGAEI